MSKNIVKPVTSGMGTAVRNGIVTRTSALADVKATADGIVRTAEWQRFNSSVDALSSLGKYLTGASVGGKLTGPVNGATLKSAFADKNSALYVADRTGFPSESVMSRAIDIAADDTSKRRDAFQTVGNRPDVQDYVPFLKLTVGKPLGSKSKVDIGATVKGKGASKVVGKITRTPAARTGSTSTSKDAAALPEFKLELATDEELAAVPTVLNIDGIVMSKRLDLARQLIASVLIDARAVKVEDALILN